ncbi:MAG: hypothetical protein V4514_16475 [Pseudomonadota bacterium]|uniref:L,D-transpeptidase n=1 Tax=unclassified Phenylobacterium TaxID=2640670 RepID=UPI000B3373F3|nr:MULTISPECIES: L,D-transpeptidase [unclassified Phenylobacterium]MBT9472751.1 hypothetical protein [Phenylobacterium sp.]
MRDAPRAVVTAWALCLGVLSAGVLLPSVAGAQATDQVDDGATLASEAVVQVADWVIASRDNNGLPFVIIDKAAAEVFVFGPSGQLRGAAPALIGLARGDDSVPGIGDRELSKIRPEERTTPAGRFLAGFGPSAHGGDALWVDYETAVSLHPVVTSNAKERRLQRLQTPTPDDNRITFGCINVPAAFYQELVLPAFTGTNGIVYVLPETRALDQVFPSFRSQATHTTGLVAASAAPEPSAATGLAANGLPGSLDAH